MKDSLWLVTALFVLTGCGDNAPEAPDAGPRVDGRPQPADAATPPPTFLQLDYAIAVDITADGQVAVFEDLSSQEAELVFVDTLTGVAEVKALIGNPGRVLATGISSDRRVSAMRGEPLQATIWSEPTGWVDLGNPFAAGCGDADLSAGFDISADGHTVVGLGWDGCHTRAIRYRDSLGTGVLTPLALVGVGPPALGGPLPVPNNRASVVSDDGEVYAGWGQNGVVDRSPARWRADGTGALLAPANMDAPGEVLSISADGGVLAGELGGEGFVWTEAGGFVTIPRPATALPSDPVYPNAMTADGAVVFGGVGNAFFSTPVAFVWSAATGTVLLQDVVTAAGVTLPEGMILGNVLGASADGRVLIGTALDAAFAPRTFVLRVPAGAFRR
jgi:hypothetical protein